MFKLGKMILIIAVTLVFLISGCNNNISTKPEIDDELVEYGKEYITIKSDGESLVFDVNELSELDKYLEESLDPMTEIDRMRFTHLQTINNFQYSLIHYGGGMKLHNNLLVKKDRDGEMISKLISQSSFYQNFEVSPNNEYIAVLFGQNEGTTVVRNDLVIIDSTTLERIKIDEVFKPYIYTILDYKWIDNKTLEITIPDIESWDFETLEDWRKLKRGETRKIRFEIH